VLSSPRICPTSKALPNKLKKKCIELIHRDEYQNLLKLLTQENIQLNDEVSKEGHGWTILHYAAKCNAEKCVGHCLRWLYQTQGDSYEMVVNLQNCEGDTALMVACFYKCNRVIKTLLELGGSDLKIKNIKKLTAY
jgi:ankyrin repeat protein